VATLAQVVLVVAQAQAAQVGFLVQVVSAVFQATLAVADSAAILVSQVHLAYQVHQVKVDFLADLAGAALAARQAYLAPAE